MRILAVTPYYEPEGGGLERYAHAILRRLARMGHDVRVVAQTRGEAGDHVRDRVRITLRHAPMHLGNAPIDPGLGRHLREVVESWSPDVMVGHGPVPYPAEIAAEVAHRTGTPFVLTYHSGRLRGSNFMLDAVAGVARVTVERRMFKRSDQVIAVSPFVRDHALRRFADKVTVVPPGVEGQFMPNGHAEPEILFVAPLDRSYRWKGVDTLMAAFEDVQKNVPHARLHLVGDGDRRDEFRARASNNPAIQIDARLEEPALIEAYQRAQVVTLPSTTDAEAFGMVLAEANACGRPVVAARSGGIPDFVQSEQNGVLVEPGDAQGLATSLIDLLRHPDKADRMGAEGRRRIQEEHDWQQLTAQTEAVLEVARRRA